MNKLVQLISGIVMVALSIGVLVFVYLNVLPAESLKSSESSVKITIIIVPTRLTSF